MSKARITYRFEHPRRSANGQALAEAIDRDAEWKAEIHDNEQKNGTELEAKRKAKADHVEFPMAEEPIVLEERKPSRPVSVLPRRLQSDYPYDYGAWYDTADGEADELERMIRSSGEYDPELEKRWTARNAMNEPAELDREAEAGYWRFTEAEAAVDEPLIRRRPPKDGPAWWKVAGSVIGAVATGLLFGTFILNMFTNTGETPQTAAENPPASATSETGGSVTETVPPTGEQGGAAGAETTGEGAVSASLDLPERRVFLLQNGVFDTLDAARTLANDMKNKGFAGTIEEGESFYVYAGVTTDRDAALRTGLLLQDSGIEVYVKPYDLPSVQEVRLTSEGAAALGEYMSISGTLVQMIGDLTLIHLDGDEAVAPEGSTMVKLKADHLRLTEQSPLASAGLTAEAQPVLKRMDDAIRNAVVAMEEYAAHPDYAYLWSAQGALIDYLIAEKRLLTAVANG